MRFAVFATSITVGEVHSLREHATRIARTRLLVALTRSLSHCNFLFSPSEKFPVPNNERASGESTTVGDPDRDEGDLGYCLRLDIIKQITMIEGRGLLYRRCPLGIHSYSLLLIIKSVAGAVRCGPSLSVDQIGYRIPEY